MHLNLFKLVHLKSKIAFSATLNRTADKNCDHHRYRQSQPMVLPIEQTNYPHCRHCRNDKNYAATMMPHNNTMIRDYDHHDR